MMKYRYGDSWERYPIVEGEVWIEAITGSRVSVCDITGACLPDYMLSREIGMVYCDPPWSLGNVNAFYTKAGRSDYIERFSDFYAALFGWIAFVRPNVCYLEIGKQNLSVFLLEFGRIFPVVQQWEITYYRENPCFLLRGGASGQRFDFTGLDDADTPWAAVNAEDEPVIADPCTGQGLTARAAFHVGRRFFGTELNPRRLAVAIDRVNKMGGAYARAVS